MVKMIKYCRKDLMCLNNLNMPVLSVYFNVYLKVKMHVNKLPFHICKIFCVFGQKASLKTVMTRLTKTSIKTAKDHGFWSFDSPGTNKYVSSVLTLSTEARTVKITYFWQSTRVSSCSKKFSSPTNELMISQ